jgi:hypothetical protein
MPAAIMLIAGAITSIISIIQKFDVLYGLEVLLGSLVLFYLIGLAAQKIILSVINTDKKKKMEEEALQENEEENLSEEQEKSEEEK